MGGAKVSKIIVFINSVQCRAVYLTFISFIFEFGLLRRGGGEMSGMGSH